jgi:hypothetical protein
VTTFASLCPWGRDPVPYVGKLERWLEILRVGMSVPPRLYPHGPYADRVSILRYVTSMSEIRYQSK